MECSEEFEYPEVAKKVHELVVDDENAYSQNDVELQTQLTVLCDFLHRTSDFKYFGTKEARLRNSDARRLVDSGSSNFKVFERNKMAKILLLAFYLGGATLDKFKRVLVDEGNRHVEFVWEALKKLLVFNFAFKENYAEWLPKNLEYLKRGSLEILKALNPKDFEHVRYSTVVSLTSSKEQKTFNLNMMAITERMEIKKRNILEKAVIASHKNYAVVSLKDFREIVEIAMNTDIAG